MTTKKAGAQPTPEQVAAGPPAPVIDIISERRIETHPVPGETLLQVAVTYRIPPNPPQVFFSSLGALPHWVFREANPDKPVPESVQKQGDEALKELIVARRRPEDPERRRI